MARPEFIAQLRAKVGHDLLWLMGTTVIVLRDGAKSPEVLLVRSKDHGVWTAIHGIVEPGEHPAETVVREA